MGATATFIAESALVDYLDSDDAEKVEVVMERVGNFVALVKADA